MIELELDGRKVSVAEGSMVMHAADAAAMPVRGMIKHFRDEFVYHVEHKRCMVAQPVTAS